MNNLSSYCRLLDAKIRASDKELPLKNSHFGDASKLVVIFMRLSTYHKVTNSNTSCLEAQAGFFRLLMKEFFHPYVKGDSMNLTVI